MEFLFTIPLNGFTKIKCMYQVLASVVSQLRPLFVLEDTYSLQFYSLNPYSYSLNYYFYLKK